MQIFKKFPFFSQDIDFSTKNEFFLTFFNKTICYTQEKNCRSRSEACFKHIPGDRAKLVRQPLCSCQNWVSYVHSLELQTLPRRWLLTVTELASLACRPAGGPEHGAYITFLKFAYFGRHT